MPLNRAPKSPLAVAAGGGTGRGRVDFDLYIEALRRYKELFGDVVVSRFFVVPATPEWPERLHNLHLGCLLREVKRGKSHVAHRPELAAMGFDFESKGMGRQSMGGNPKVRGGRDSQCKGLPVRR